MTVDYNVFLNRHAGGNPATALSEAALNVLLSGQDAWLVSLFGGLANLPAEAENLNFGEEQRLTSLRKELAMMATDTEKDITDDFSQRVTAHSDDLVWTTSLVKPWLHLIKDLLKRVIAWHPQSDDDAVLLALELFRSELLTWLHGGLRWANEQYKLGTTTYLTPGITAQQYHAQRIARLEAEILKCAANVEIIYAQARAELPFLLALRDQFPAFLAATV